MKKLLLAFSIVFLLASCGSDGEKKEEKKGKDDAKTEKTEKKIEKVSFTSWEILTMLGEDKEGLLNTLKDKKVTITHLVVETGNYSIATTRGYDGTQIMGYSRPDDGYTIIVNGMEMPEYKGDYFYVELQNLIGDESMEILSYDQVTEDEKKTTTYRTILSIEADGNTIEVKDDNTLLIDGATIIDHQNME